MSSYGFASTEFQNFAGDDVRMSRLASSESDYGAGGDGRPDLAALAAAAARRRKELAASQPWVRRPLLHPEFAPMVERPLVSPLECMRGEMVARNMQILMTWLVTHRSNRGIFNEPVDPQALGIADYFYVIRRPLDLGTVRERMQSGVWYRFPVDAARDIRLVFRNAIVYNPVRPPRRARRAAPPRSAPARPRAAGPPGARNGAHRAPGFRGRVRQGARRAPPAVTCRGRGRHGDAAAARPDAAARSCARGCTPRSFGTSATPARCAPAGPARCAA